MSISAGAAGQTEPRGCPGAQEAAGMGSHQLGSYTLENHDQNREGEQHSPALVPAGRAVLVVQQFPWLFPSISMWHYQCKEFWHLPVGARVG